ncbi:MAG TPA: extracellular solute-binding protein [Anaerolineaceae bacterium]|nr:extracellular solute-binding protein [Anaerolineaceae bacterium]
MNRGLRLALVIAVLALAGCTGSPSPAQTPSSGSATQGVTSMAPTQGIGTPSASTAANQTPTSPVTDLNLIIWAPKEFDPASGTAAGDLLNERLQAFSAQNPGVTIEVRVKASSGPSNLLESLSAASAAAPNALPDLVVLSRPDLEVAALKGLLTPLDGLSDIPNDPDWYDYARQLALVQNSTFGVPFAGDALVLLYRPVAVSKPPLDWDTLLAQSGPLAFPAGDREALFTLAMYRAQGGEIEDAQGRPALSVEPLSKVFSIYKSAVSENLFPYWVGQLENDDQSWAAYQEQRANIVVSWVSRYLMTLPPDTIAQPLPAVSQSSLTMASGWLFALGNPDTARHPISVKLAEFLVESDFLADWTQAAGYLPTRPTALAGWSDQATQTFLSQVVLSAQARPKSDLILSLGPVLRDATIEILKGQSDPTETAQTASDRLAAP